MGVEDSIASKGDLTTGVLNDIVAIEKVVVQTFMVAYSNTSMISPGIATIDVVGPYVQ
jgi:hypothetical protein